jgi:hypothetical protein
MSFTSVTALLLIRITRRFFLMAQQPVLGQGQYNTHKRHSYLPAGFEPAIPGSNGLRTHVVSRAATGVGTCRFNLLAPEFGI